MAEHGDFFPENPRNTEELLDSLAAAGGGRAAAAQLARPPSSAPSWTSWRSRRSAARSLIESAGPPGREPAGAAARRGLGRRRSASAATTGMGLGEGTRALADIAELEQLAEQLSQQYAGAQLDDIDPEALARQLGDEAAADARTLAELERELQRAGLPRPRRPTASGGCRRRRCASSGSRRSGMWRSDSRVGAASATPSGQARRGSRRGPAGAGSSATPSRGT